MVVAVVDGTAVAGMIVVVDRMPVAAVADLAVADDDDDMTHIAEKVADLVVVDRNHIDIHRLAGVEVVAELAVAEDGMLEQHS